MAKPLNPYLEHFVFVSEQKYIDGALERDKAKKVW